MICNTPNKVGALTVTVKNWAENVVKKSNTLGHLSWGIEDLKQPNLKHKLIFYHKMIIWTSWMACRIQNFYCTCSIMFFSRRSGRESNFKRLNIWYDWSGSNSKLCTHLFCISLYWWLHMPSSLRVLPFTSIDFSQNSAHFASHKSPSPALFVLPC